MKSLYIDRRGRGTTRRGLVSALMGLVVGSGLCAQALSAQTMTLGAAVASGKVSASVSGTGASSGDSVKVTVAKTPAAGPGNLALTVPPGTRLASSDAGAQSMVVSGVRGRMAGGNDLSYEPTSVITVGSRPVTYVLDAYCAEFEKENPSSSTAFRVASQPDARLGCVLRQASAGNLSVEATQAAVWIVTDAITFEHMSQKFDITSQDFARARAVAARCGPGR